MVSSLQKFKDKGVENEKEKFSLLFNMLDGEERKLLDKLSQLTNLPKEEICEFLFYNSATSSSIKKFEQENKQYAKLLKEISYSNSKLGDYREIKDEYLKLIQDIRNPSNLA